MQTTITFPDSTMIMNMTASEIGPKIYDVVGTLKDGDKLISVSGFSIDDSNADFMRRLYGKERAVDHYKKAIQLLSNDLRTAPGEINNFQSTMIWTEDNEKFINELIDTVLKED